MSRGPSSSTAARFTILEASRYNDIPHVSVCGGRGRCSTCRVRIIDGAQSIPEADTLERRTLERVNAAIARVQPVLPPTAKVTANRLTFAAFPIMGYSLTSDKIPQTTLWELATYTLKPRLNRASGVSSVVVQGGEVPEFQLQPDPALALTLPRMPVRRAARAYSKRHS